MKITEYMVDLGVSTGMTHDTPKYNRGEGPSLPVAQLDATRWAVVDVDSAGGLGEFTRALRAHRGGDTGALAGLVAYVETDKGVALVYIPTSICKCLIDGDVRYERIAQERSHYAMHLLSKVTGLPRYMVGLAPWPGTGRRPGRLL